MEPAENWEFFYRRGKRDWGWRLRRNRALVKTSARLFEHFIDCLADAVESGFDGKLSMPVRQTLKNKRQKTRSISVVRARTIA
jgi:hypothetical protein